MPSVSCASRTRELLGRKDLPDAHLVVDEGRPRVDDLAPARHVVEHEVTEVRDVVRGDLHEEVVGAGDRPHREHLGSIEHLLLEGVHRGRRLRTQPDADHRSQRSPHRIEVHLRVPAPDDPLRAQRADALETRGLRDPDGLGEVLVGLSGVELEEADQGEVRRVEPLWLSAHRVKLRPVRDTVSILVVCTGNTCRSVMSGVMLEHLASLHGVDLRVATAGTHTVDGLPVSARTLAALRTVPGLGLGPAPAGGRPAPAGGPGPTRANGHRSRQLATESFSGADLVVAMEAAHVRFVRRHHPEAAARTGLIRTFARELEPAPAPPGVPAPLAARVAAMGLAEVQLDESDDVEDPAGHEDDAYVACAAELWDLCNALVTRL